MVWSGGDKSTSLWCAYSGQFLGTIDRGREMGLPESSSFTRDSLSRPVMDDWKAKVDTSKASTAATLLQPPTWFWKVHTLQKCDNTVSKDST